MSDSRPSGKQPHIDGLEPTEVQDTQVATDVRSPASAPVRPLLGTETTDVAAQISGTAATAGVDPPSGTETTDVAQASTLTHDAPKQASARKPAADDGLARLRAATAEMEAASAPEPALVPGYRLIDEIAKSDMARIYKAEQTSVNRKVTIKVINREFARDSQARARFRREAAVLAKIEHPNIVEVFDIGTTAGREPYLILEHVAGGSLADLLRDHGRLPIDEAVSLLLQIARALHTVHEHGVIHRDLKPGNILVTTSPTGIRVAKLADFGLAKVPQSQQMGQFKTRAGTILGTPEYMSPEQIKGTAVDRRADVYSLGCLTYEILTGKPPFVADDRMATLYRHLHERPPALRKACPEADLPAPFQTLIDRALAKEAEERIPSALEFYVELLAASDQAGIERPRLHIVESLFDDIAYAKTEKSNASPAHKAAPPPTKPRSVQLLIYVTVAIAALALGVLLERLLGAG